MKSLPSTITIILGALFLSIPVIITSCSKKEFYKIEGIVLDPTGSPVVNAKVEVFNNPDDWLTGLHVVATMKSDLIGEFKSAKIFEEGDYYIFVEKYDTSNWNIRDVEKGIYPMIHLPLGNRTIQNVEPSNMGLLANTSWELSNTLEEYSKSAVGSAEWKSNWVTSNNCEKDNSIHFGKDLSMHIDEGQLMCKNSPNILYGSFIPPMVFNQYSCDRLLHTSENVKIFQYEGWTEMKEKNGEMYISCSQSTGQLYIIYDITSTKKGLQVYSRRN